MVCATVLERDSPFATLPRPRRPFCARLLRVRCVPYSTAPSRTVLWRCGLFPLARARYVLFRLVLWRGAPSPSARGRGVLSRPALLPSPPSRPVHAQLARARDALFQPEL